MSAIASKIALVTLCMVSFHASGDRVKVGESVAEVCPGHVPTPGYYQVKVNNQRHECSVHDSPTHFANSEAVHRVKDNEIIRVGGVHNNKTPPHCHYKVWYKDMPSEDRWIFAHDFQSGQDDARHYALIRVSEAEGRAAFSLTAGSSNPSPRPRVPRNQSCSRGPRQGDWEKCIFRGTALYKLKRPVAITQKANATGNRVGTVFEGQVVTPGKPWYLKLKGSNDVSVFISSSDSSVEGWITVDSSFLEPVMRPRSHTQTASLRSRNRGQRTREIRPTTTRVQSSPASSRTRTAGTQSGNSAAAVRSTAICFLLALGLGCLLRYFNRI